MELLDLLREVGPHVVAVLTVLVSVLASGHAVLRKRDVRAAVAWVGLVWLAPVVGAVLYLLLGINRIRRRARSLTLRQEHGHFPPAPSVAPLTAEALAQALPPAMHLASLTRGSCSHARLLPGKEPDCWTAPSHQPPRSVTLTLPRSSPQEPVAPSGS